MGPKMEPPQSCGTCGLRAVVSGLAFGLALSVSGALAFGAAELALRAQAAKLMLPSLTSMLIGLLTTHGEHGGGVSFPAVLLLAAVLVVPYFLACRLTPCEERGTAGGLALRLAVSVAVALAALMLGAFALALPFAHT